MSHQTINSYKEVLLQITGRVFSSLSAILFVFLTGLPVLAQEQSDLESGFQNPPNSAQLRTWWHWVNSNVTEEGITRDLEWMQRVGIGGFMMFDVTVGGGQNVEDKTIVFTPEWYEKLRHTAEEAQRLGLEMTIHSSAGWSETGGPWVEPNQAMKKAVWSTTRVQGPGQINQRLELPPGVIGPYGRFERSTPGQEAYYYEDVRVVAYRTPATEDDVQSGNVTLNSNAGELEFEPLNDGDYESFITLPFMAGTTESWLEFNYAEPQTIRAFTIAMQGSRGFGTAGIIPQGSLQASMDGVNYEVIASLPGQQHDIRDMGIRTFSVPETTARYFRFEFTSPVGGTSSLSGFQRPQIGEDYRVSELTLHSGGRVNRFEDKAAFAILFNYEVLPTHPVGMEAVVETSDVIDLTDATDENGQLSWMVPEGDWTVIRLGYSLTGAENGPAVPEGTGFEVDKLNSEHMEAYYRGYTEPMREALGDLYGDSLQYFLVDSFESDQQNWTDDIMEEFLARRGYDPLPYLPVLTGMIVESAEISDRFLWDFRRTLADLLAEEHYGAIAELAHEQSMQIYSEAMGVSLPFLGDALMNKGRVDIPMGEFFISGDFFVQENGWQTPTSLPYSGASYRPNAYWSDVREAASGSRLYNKGIVGAESWTGGGYEAPFNLKWPGDYWASQGVNRYIFHTSAHQPLDSFPGNTMVGTHLHRNITWAEQADGFIGYLNRNMFMLQQGEFVGDILYFLGEDIPAAVPYWEKITPEAPEGYDFDFTNAEVLLERASIVNGRIQIENGPSYAVLVLPEQDTMTLHMARRIEELVQAGATVLGPRPVRSPGLAGYPLVDDEVAAIGRAVWGDIDGRTVLRHAYGEGQVFSGVSLADLLGTIGIQPDVEYQGMDADTYLETLHRRTDEADIYFVSNQRDRAETVELRFRISGKTPELWHSDTGLIEPAAYSMNTESTTVSIPMERRGSVFVVFREATTIPARAAREFTEAELMVMNEDWMLDFPQALGGDGAVSFANLFSWTEHDDRNIAYFSGTASYTRNFQVTAQWLQQNQELLLDLGDVRDIAEVLVNGEAMGVLWKPPYQVDVSEVLRRGNNSLEVRVTNQWTNRIALDRTLPPEQRVLTDLPPLRFGPPPIGSEPPPVPQSGLLGPVVLKARN